MPAARTGCAMPMAKFSETVRLAMERHPFRRLALRDQGCVDYRLRHCFNVFEEIGQNAEHCGQVPRLHEFERIMRQAEGEPELPRLVDLAYKLLDVDLRDLGTRCGVTILSSHGEAP